MWGVLTICTGAKNLSAQSSFDTDPFSSRFREKGGFEPKFRLPDKGGTIRIAIDKGEPGGPQGKQTIVEEDLFTADAPPGKFVTIEYQDVKLTARSVHGSLKKKTVVAEGDVTFEQGASRMQGVRLELDLAEKTGVLTDGRMDLEGGLHLKGATLAKVGPRSFTLTDGMVTSCEVCEGQDPSWKFKVKSARVTLEEFARLKGVTFSMGGVPLLWTPYLIWPALRDRASGFLIPGLGYNSNRGGYLGVSYYWAISRSADATFSGDFYTKQYYGFGAELRARPSEGTRFEGTYYTIKDPTIDSWRWQTQGALVSNDLGPKLRGVVTWLDLSDPNFFQDFNRNFGLSSTRSLKSEGFVTWNPDPFALNLRVSREEALGYGSGSVVSERLPTLEASLRPTPFFGQAVFVEASAQGGVLRTDRGEGLPSGTYDRFDLFPKVNVPFSLFPWLSLEGTAGVRITTYGKSLAPDGTTLTDERYNREALSTEVSLTGPAFSRLFEGKLGPVHEVQARDRAAHHLGLSRGARRLRADAALRRDRFPRPDERDPLLAAPASPRQRGPGRLARDRLVRGRAQLLREAPGRKYGLSARRQRPEELSSGFHPARQRDVGPEPRREDDLGPPREPGHVGERHGGAVEGRALPLRSRSSTATRSSSRPSSTRAPRPSCASRAGCRSSRSGSGSTWKRTTT